MKASIHPNYVESIVRCACGNEFTTRSTLPEMRVELCSRCHPFYTGEQRLVDTAGRVERFNRRYSKAAAPEAPTVTAPTVRAPAAKAPTPEATTAEAPIAEAPVAETPAAKAATPEAPVAEAPAKAPAAKTPATKAPAAKRAAKGSEAP